MTLDWTGLAAVIVAVGTIIDRILTQINTRAALKEQAATLAKQNVVLARMDGNVDGNLSETKAIAAALGAKKDAFAAEVERVHSGGEPTPVDTPPTADNKVTILDGRATTLVGDRAVPLDKGKDK